MTQCGAPAAAGPEESFAESLILEIAHLLDRLAGSGASGAIDLRSLPMSEADRAELEDFLGRGEVEATLSTAGGSDVRETGYPGVWWICHRGSDGRISSETIEITLIPEILKAHMDDLPIGLKRLREDIENRQFEFQSGENE